MSPAHLPHDLSPWGMFLAADPIVKGILIGLALASVATWTVWLAKSLQLIAARRSLRRQIAALGLQPTVTRSRDTAEGRGAVWSMVAAAVNEIEQSPHVPDPTSLKERIILKLQRIEADHARRIARGTGILATIGATAPFVGLFGTVWGIMNSFVNIARAHTTNLAVVAPGIAEALLATAIGLAAAIPAVVIYNAFARSIAAYKGMLGDGAAEVLRLSIRDIETRQTGAAASHRPYVATGT